MDVHKIAEVLWSTHPDAEQLLWEGILDTTFSHRP